MPGAKCAVGAMAIDEAERFAFIGAAIIVTVHAESGSDVALVGHAVVVAVLALAATGNIAVGRRAIQVAGIGDQIVVAVLGTGGYFGSGLKITAGVKQADANEVALWWPIGIETEVVERSKSNRVGVRVLCKRFSGPRDGRRSDVDVPWRIRQSRSIRLGRVV
mgnify:CR=1 FL=1